MKLQLHTVQEKIPEADRIISMYSPSAHCTSPAEKFCGAFSKATVSPLTNIPHNLPVNKQKKPPQVQKTGRGDDRGSTLIYHSLTFNTVTRGTHGCTFGREAHRFQPGR